MIKNTTVPKHIMKRFHFLSHCTVNTVRHVSVAFFYYCTLSCDDEKFSFIWEITVIIMRYCLPNILLSMQKKGLWHLCCVFDSLSTKPSKSIRSRADKLGSQVHLRPPKVLIYVRYCDAITLPSNHLAMD